MNKSLKIIAVLFVLIAFWIFYFILQFIYGSPTNSNLDFIPSNSTTIAAIDGDLAIKSVLSDLLSSKDEYLLEKINDSKSDFKQSSGIDVLSDFVLFVTTIDHLEIKGLLVNLNSEADFNNKFNTQIIASNSSVGLIVLEENRNNKSKVKQIVRSLLNEKTTLYSENLKSLRKDNSLISIWTKPAASKDWNYANLTMIGSKIQISGTAVIPSQLGGSWPKIKPVKNSFHAGISAIVPNAMSDSILKFLKIENNKLVGFSSNYRSLKIEQEKSFQIVPDGDFIFHFEKPADVKSILQSALENELISELTPGQYNFGEESYFYDQLSLNSFYIGRSSLQKIQIEQNASILSFHGSPIYLSKIEGNPLMLRLINIFPAYRAGTGLLKAIKTIDINVEPTSGKSVKISGEIVFKNEKYASIELIRNLMELR